MAAEKRSTKVAKKTAKRATAKVVKKAKTVAKPIAKKTKTVAKKKAKTSPKKSKAVAKKKAKPAPKKTTAAKAVKKAATAVVTRAKKVAKQIVRAVERATETVTQAAEQVASSSASDDAGDHYASARLVRHDGKYSLAFSEWDAATPVFESRQRLGNGYDWAGVVDYLVKQRAPEIAEHLSYDPEAGMFAVVSTNEDALAKVRELIRLAMTDAQVLGDAIDHTEED